MEFLIRHAEIDDAAGIARVRAEGWLGAYRGIVPDAFLNAIDVGEWAERQHRNMENDQGDLVSFVAETQGQVVGWALGGPNREDDPDYSGELYAIYLLPERQRRGIGLKLTAATARWLIGEGMDSIDRMGAGGEPSGPPVLRSPGRPVCSGPPDRDRWGPAAGGVLRLAGPGQAVGCRLAGLQAVGSWPPDSP